MPQLNFITFVAGNLGLAFSTVIFVMLLPLGVARKPKPNDVIYVGPVNRFGFRSSPPPSPRRRNAWD